MKGVEEVGGVKYDFLGVKTLASMGTSMRSINKRKNLKIIWGEFPHDPNVYSEIIWRMLLAAIFQLNTKTMAPFVNGIRPKSTRDLSAIGALVRPGALEAPSPDPRDPPDITAAMYYVMCCQGKRQPYYVHPDLKTILEETHGVLLYQEQALQIARDFGGYSYEKAEELRRGIGKKDAELVAKCLKELKEAFLNYAKWDEAAAEHVCQTIKASSRYSFNKAHSASYGIVGYNGCWLKHHHLLDFWKGELTIRGDDHDKLREYLRECQKLIVPVSVVSSAPHEWTIETTPAGDRLRPPLTTVKGCGIKSADYLRKFLDSDNLELLMNAAVVDSDEPDETPREDEFDDVD
jgi:DNA polymerase-3 subunit alpha